MINDYDKNCFIFYENSSSYYVYLFLQFLVEFIFIYQWMYWNHEDMSNLQYG